jgi:hypothetical protein
MKHFGIVFVNITNHYQASFYAHRPTYYLKTEWGVIKHDVTKFINNFTIVQSLCKSRINIENTFNNVLDLYKLKHSKGSNFTFICCWLMLKDILR